VQGRVSAPGGPVVLSAPDWIVVYDECSGVVPIGSGYCGPAATNSTGQAGKLNAYGSDCSNSNRVTLVASQLPADQLGIFLCSQGQGFVAHPGGSAGNLCLGGGMAIGRFNEPAQAQVSNQNHLALGYYMQLDLDLMRLPRPAPGYDVAMANQTWNFQAWYRDNGQNNFTDAVSIRFR
ncbi:MAG: hypothetical protein P1V35_16680, partial [Planctomycetota bacterium]|nr:hypothetical protein [Planctomycetota bacterium]